MRTKQSLKNIIATVFCYIITLVIGFVSRSYFARLLGVEYLGINSLFQNVISVMSVVELGFGSAIIYNLYRPLSENNHTQVKSLVQYYKRIYSIIALLICALGLVITPFIPRIVGNITVNINLYIVFWLFVIGTASSYLLTYKRSVFYADQKNYTINIIHVIIYVISTFIQISVLIILSNYYLYLILNIFFNILENLLITFLANYKYKYLREKVKEPLSHEIKQDIIKKVKGLLFHQIGASIVMGTDNIIMSMTKSLGVIMVGKYSNYIMIINNLNNFIGQIFTSVTASVGNLLLEENEENTYNVYKRILFLNAALCNFVCISVYVCIDPFIKLWLGNDYILPNIVIILIVLNFYIQGMKRTCGIFKNAGGIFYEDRFVPLVESIINLVVSIGLVYLWGVSGIILGTIISSMVHWLYDFPKYVYGIVLKKCLKQYIWDYLPYFFIFIISIFITKIICNFIILNNIFILLLINIVLCIIIPNFIFLVIFHKTNEFIYWKNFIIEKIINLKNRINIKFDKTND